MKHVLKNELIVRGGRVTARHDGTKRVFLQGQRIPKGATVTGYEGDPKHAKSMGLESGSQKEAR